MFCAQCGTETQADNKFCKHCGAAVGAAAAAAQAAVAQAPLSYPPPPGMPPGTAMPPGPPPGMVPVAYQAYAGGPQQVYYVPAQGVQAQAGVGLLEGIRSRIRALASTEKLEGFSLSETFSETFTHHGAEAVEEYMMVGASRTTPPVEMVETGWPRPWMFFRLLALLAIAALVLYAVWQLTTNIALMPSIVIMGAFAMPVAVLVFVFEMNTPRNVSVVQLLKLFIVGGLAASCVVSFEYMNPTLGRFPGIMEETAKLAGVLLVMRSGRYRYLLNGILFGCAVGAGFACFETCFYALLNNGGFLQTYLPEWLKAQVELANAVTQIQLQQAQADLQKALTDAMAALAHVLVQRGLLAPFGHPVWTAIAAGAFWRVKQDKPTTVAMLMDSRFLKAFAIPVVLHSIWDIGITFPKLFNPQTQGQANTDEYIIWTIYGVLSVIAWYVLFTMIQQGLHQVRDQQKAQLESTLVNVEATLGLGTKRPQIPVPQPVAPTGAAQA